jgi:hypothetical protein
MVEGSGIWICTYSLEGAVRMFEVHDCRPIVGEIFNERAGRAAGHGRKIIVWIHGDVESKGSGVNGEPQRENGNTYAF